MKTSRYIILSFAAVAIAASCKEELNPDKPINANPGDEVVFGAALPGKTKTVYGEENTVTNTFPIYWVNGDKVRVASPQCMSGRNTAEYKVAVDGPTQNYATALTKIGDAGVQWGDAATADFYSIYPSSASTKLEVSGEGVTTTLHVDATQFASTNDNGTSYYAQPAEMGNVVMYAKTAGVTKGSTVELHYTPFSTVLEFEINASNEEVAGEQKEITIQSLTLTAPTTTTTIAGDFGFTFPADENATPSITPAATGGSNTITMHFLDNNQYTTVLSTTKTTLKAKMCLMPISGNLAGWKVEVNTSAGTFSKTLTETDKDGKKTDLIAGQVHKIKLPPLKYATQEWVYSTSDWTTSLPDYTNIYLSELSLPGAWYAGATEGVSDGTGYQATSSITDLWNAGVRAFAVECRSYTARTGWLGGGNLTNSEPSRIALSGTGTDKNGAYTSPTRGSCTYLSSIISSVAGVIKSNEYGVLVLSYADGGDGGHRTLDYQYFINGIAKEITQSGATNIYSGEKLDKNTTVKDVLGKLIIKVNVDDNITIGSYGSNQNYLISHNPFLSQIDEVSYEHPYYSDLHWKTWLDAYKNASQLSENQNIPADKFIWVFSSANRTQNDKGPLSYPTYTQRQTALSAMMYYSKRIYDASTHNVWFYFNCGGTLVTTNIWGIENKDPSPTEFAKTMNLWLKNTINAKTDPSPLGIVMFNQCTGANATYYGEDIIKAIIEMNSKFYLKHAGTSGGSTGGSTSGNDAPNDATFANGSNAI